jgi:uroporphyrinogen-III synthase
MHALITRPLEDAKPLAELLAGRGVECTVEPLLEIAPHPEAAIDLEGVQALLFTSANGVRAFAAAKARRDLPVFAVGDATAAEARRLGFARVASAGGDVEDLARLVVGRFAPENGSLVHAAGTKVAGDLAALLVAAGFSVRRAVLYEAAPAGAFSASVAAALRTGDLDLAVFFSPRTAACFARLAAALPARTTEMTALCLSPAVAAALAPLPWRTVAVAARPSMPALLARLDATPFGRHSPTRTSEEPNCA